MKTLSQIKDAFAITTAGAAGFLIDKIISLLVKTIADAVSFLNIYMYICNLFLNKYFTELDENICSNRLVLPLQLST